MNKKTLFSLITFILVITLPLFVSGQEQTALSGVSISGNYTNPKATLDGKTIKVYFKLKNSNEATVDLGLDFLLIDPNGKEVDDLKNRKIVSVTKGERWYSRELFVNLPPGCETGAKYDAVWKIYEVQDGAFADLVSSETRTDYITVNDPEFIRIPLLVYHNIGQTTPDQYWVKQTAFIAQMKALKAYGYTPVTFQSIMNDRADIQCKKKVIITFDDGKDNFLSQAFPVISDPQYKFRVTHFLPTGRIENTGHLTWEQIRTMEKSGLVDFQSHTVTHTDLVTLSDPELIHQLVFSKETIEQELAKEVKYLAYPFGSYDTRVQNATRDAGYFAALGAWGGVEETIQDKWALKRVKIISSTSVNYDKEHPENFFLTRIGDQDVKIPNVSINRVDFLDPRTNYILPNGEVAAGGRIKIRFKISNTGDKAPVTATLKIDSDNDPTNGVLFDSHSSKDIVCTLKKGTSDLVWTWDVPDNTPDGQYYISLDIHDHRYVLGFSFSGMLTGFVVNNHVTPASITVTSPNGGEAFIKGQNLPICWTSTGTVGDIAIYFSYNGGRRWKKVADSLPNTGLFNWTAPNIESGNCLIKIRANGGDLDDRSDASFSIVKPGIEDQSVSVNTSRDGRTVQLGFKITNPGSDTIRLGFDALMIDPKGKVAKDPKNRVIREIGPGSHWISIDYLINVPPGAPLDDAYFDIVWQAWTIEGDEFVEIFSSSKLNDAILIKSNIVCRIPILMYHNIGDSTPSKYWTLTSEFRAQMNALKAYGYTSIHLQDLMDERAGIAEAKKMMLTFDDGWIGMYNNAYPILSSEEINYKFTSFVYTDAIGWSNFMDWDQIRELHDSGLGDIQSHTLSHLHLTKISKRKLEWELVESKRILENALNKEINFISYPYGDFNYCVQKAAHDAGYFAGIGGFGGIEPCTNNKWEIKRVLMLSNISVCLDKNKPENFFMTLIEPEFAVPLIEVNGIQYLDPATGQPLPDNQVIPGSSVKIRVTATNTGQSAPVTATLRIDSDANPANGIVFDSHLVEPSQDIVETFAEGQKTYEWIWQVPQNAAPGVYSVQLAFKDAYYVFCYETSAWLSGFAVAGSCIAPQITSQPSSTTVEYNTSATLSVSVTGSQPLNYQWYLGTSGDESCPISGADTVTLITPTLTETSYFWVKLSNACGTVCSVTATVTVTTPSNNPGWEPKTDLNCSMIVKGVAYYNGTVAKAGDWLGAFGPGGEDDCRGVVTIQESGHYHLTIFSDICCGDDDDDDDDGDDDGGCKEERITFKLWPLPGGPSTNADQTIKFEDGATICKKTLTFGENCVQEIKLKKSWNWVSFNILPSDLSLDAFFASILDEIIYVKTQFRSASRCKNRWSGDLTDMSDIAKGRMYLIKTRSAVTLEVVGTKVSLDTTIQLKKCWNWVAYLPNKCLPTVTGVHSVFDKMIEIRSQYATAINSNGNLEGDLSEMCSGLGYVIKMSGDAVLDYSSNGRTGLIPIDNLPENPAERNTPWSEINGNRYNMISAGTVRINGEPIVGDGYYLALFGPGGEADCRAIREISPGGQFYATVLGEKAGESLHFKLYDSHTGKVLESSSDPVTFQPDADKNSLDIQFRQDGRPPTLELSKDKLIFAATVGQKSAGSKTVSIFNRGTGAMSWAVLSDQAWIKCTPLSGNGDGQITVSVETSGLTAGFYRGGVTVFDSGTADSSRRIVVELTVFKAEAKSETAGSIISPANGVTGISGNLSVSGWAVSATGVERVTLWREPSTGEASGPNGLIYLGEADRIVGARPELVEQYPDYPGNERAGWGYNLTTHLLPAAGNGTTTIHARAEDGNGRTFELGSRTFTCDNYGSVEPFGAIAVPEQADNGSYQLLSSGWTLSPAGLIPTDGSTIRVWVNGVPVGHPQYGEANSEIDTLFPGYANSGAAFGRYLIDTSLLPSGRHTLAWSVTDSAGNSAQIGTRYFVTDKTQSLSASGMGRYGLLADTAAIPAALSPVYMRSGYRHDVTATPVQANGEQKYEVEIAEAVRLEILFGEAGRIDFKRTEPGRLNETVNWKREYTRNGVLQGYLIVGDQLKPLPAGSTLDRVNNSFHWQPGAGFVGEYRLLFVEGQAGRASKKREVTIRIRPKTQEVDSTL